MFHFDHLRHALDDFINEIVKLNMVPFLIEGKNTRNCYQKLLSLIILWFHQIGPEIRRRRTDLSVSCPCLVVSLSADLILSGFL